MNANRHISGYTLIEVLIAMMILALALTVIFRIFSGGLRNIGVAADYSRAVTVAESVLAATSVTEILQPGETSGRLFEKYSWVRTVSPYRPESEPTAANPSVEAFHVLVTVEWRGRNKTRSIDLSTLQLVPTHALAGR